MDEDAKRPKAVSLCWVRSDHEEGIEGDGWIDGERTHVLVSSEENLVESRPGATRMSYGQFGLAAQRERKWPTGGKERDREWAYLAKRHLCIYLT